MKIQIKKVASSVKLPRFAQPGDAGMDIFSNEEVIVAPGQRHSVSTGVAMKIPEGHAGFVWDKSGPSHKFGIKVLGGVVDSNYTGEWLIGLINLGQEDFEIKKGQKIAQVIFQKVESPEIEEVDELPETNRGSGGFGSTGIM